MGYLGILESHRSFIIIKSASLSYFRTIKPNETKRPKDWENDRVMHQVLSWMRGEQAVGWSSGAVINIFNFRSSISGSKKISECEERDLHIGDLSINLLKGYQKLTNL